MSAWPGRGRCSKHSRRRVRRSLRRVVSPCQLAFLIGCTRPAMFKWRQTCLPPDTAMELSALAERLAELAPNHRIDWSIPGPRKTQTNSEPRRCSASTLRNPRATIEPRRRGERPDVLVEILITKLPNPPGTTDHILLDWRSAGLRAESRFRGVRVDGAPFGAERNRPSQRARLGFGESVRPGGLCNLTWVPLSATRPCL
jgi:hypothetical protein